MITQAHIRQYWDQIKFTLIGPMLDPGELPEDIYAACLKGDAFCFVSDLGYMIVQEHKIPWTDKKKLFIWKACRWDNQTGLIEAHMKDIEDMAKAIGVSKIGFSTQRRGFAKALGPEWREAHVYYERDV